MTPSIFTTRVVRTEDLTSHLRRVVLTGDRIGDFPDNGFTDRYVKVLFPPAGVTYVDDVDVRSLPPERRPRFRTYTIRRVDHDRGELWIDFVLHGEGIAGRWAAGARPGDELLITAPGGAYRPAEGAAFHLFVGDDAVLPAISSALEALDRDADGLALLEVEGPDDELDLDAPAGVEIRWLHRRDGGGPDALLDAVRAATLPDDGVAPFVHGELLAVRAIGAHLVAERGIPRDRMSISGYWRRGKDEDGFQAEKRALAAADAPPPT